ncbi:MAG TPA: hypothetical protein VGC08_01280, partial [Pedobacter sp.]
SNSGKKARFGSQSTALRRGEEAPEGTRLIETRRRNGASVHVSRGRLQNIDALSDEQAAALHGIASASDAARTALGENPTREEKREHARVHNAAMREELLSDRFINHRLGHEARAKNAREAQV